MICCNLVLCVFLRKFLVPKIPIRVMYWTFCRSVSKRGRGEGGWGGRNQTCLQTHTHTHQCNDQVKMIQGRTKLLHSTLSHKWLDRF